MKDNFYKYLVIIFLCFASQNSLGEEVFIKALEVELNKDNKTVYAEGDVEIFDKMNNVIFAEKAEYNKLNGIVKTIGPTKIVTSEKYEIEGEDIFYDDNKKIMYSQNQTIVTDIDKNKISVDMFNYLTLKNMLFSKGEIEVTDKRKNKYLFSEIYIDEKNKKIVGSDIKSFINDETLKEDNRNEPRLYANSGTITEGVTVFEKGVFTSCKKRENKKCPPWMIRAEKIEHDNAKKTIYYTNAVMKIYDFPVFYFPKFFHPDPTVKRQSGFLLPSVSSNSMVGSGTTVPYFWAMSKDRDMTITPKLYANENILIMNEYRQAFNNASLIVDSSYTEGYRRNSNQKLPGSRSHFFSKYIQNFSETDEYFNDLEINIQRVSNPTYLEVHEINTDLVDYEKNILTTNLNYEFQDDTNFFGLSASMYEDLKKTDRSRYEYVLPNLSFERNVFADEDLGLINVFSNAYVKNVNVNDSTKMWINDVNWKSKPFTNFKGLQSEFEGLVKVVNYEADADKYKTEGFNSEASMAAAYNVSLPLSKKNNNQNKVNFLTPKMSLRFAPGHMRNIQDDDLKLSYSNLFSLNKNSQGDVVEKGTSMALGVELSNNEFVNGIPGEKNYSLAIGQVYNVEQNQDIPRRSSLHQNNSDVVGKGFVRLSKNLNLTSEFSLDNGFNGINYNDLTANLILGNANFNLKYLEENNHIGSTHYVKSDLKISIDESNELNFDIRKNLETESTEFYSLAYDYLNDCLRAGVVFRRKFYQDRDVEHADSLMLQISLIPLGDVFTPKIK